MSEEVQAATETETGQEPQNETDAGRVEETSQPTGQGSVGDLPVWAQSIITDLRKESAAHRTKAKAAEKAAQKAREAELAEQAKWQELAETRQARIDELEPLTQRVETYQGVIEELLTARIDTLGERAKKAVDGLPGELDALEKLKWLADNEALFAQPVTPDIDATARGGGGDVTVPDDFRREFAARMGMSPANLDEKALAIYYKASLKK